MKVDRFNKMLDEYEPARKREKSIVEEPIAAETPEAPEGDLFGLSTPITGKELSNLDLERGPEVIASIYIHDLEEGNGSEEELSSKLELALKSCAATTKSQQKVLRNGLLSFAVHPTVPVAELLKPVQYHILACLRTLVIYRILV